MRSTLPPMNASFARRALVVLSILACLLLLLAQFGAYLDFVLVPQPTAATSGPQSSGDLVFGLLALGGCVLGVLLTIVTGILGLVLAAVERRTFWIVTTCASGALAILGLAVSAFILLGLPRNPYHPFIVFIVVPLTTLAYSFSAHAARAKSGSG